MSVSKPAPPAATGAIDLGGDLTVAPEQGATISLTTAKVAALTGSAG